jgi:alpha-galactosidase
LVTVFSLVVPCIAAPPEGGRPLAATPPMGWNDWDRYECGYTAEDLLSNARALVKTGLAARGYDTVTIDDCWMLKDRDSHGDLQADRERFPEGMKAFGQSLHGLGLKFGIYEDAGYQTCVKFAGSGDSEGGKDHFLQDTRLFRSWGVDFLKLDACYVYVPKGSTKLEAFRKAYAAQSAAIKAVGRPMVFSESAPAYFQRTPEEWYDVLSWIGSYGQLWREGTDMATFQANKPDASRFRSMLWNYAYNLPLGRFQKPGNWNDPDFVIGGDNGMTLEETRTNMALWAMMSSPLILSCNVNLLSPAALEILGNKAVIAVDQDALGRMATLVRRTPVMDVLFKPLHDGGGAVAVLNRGATHVSVSLGPADFNLAANPECRAETWDLWSGAHQTAASSLEANIAPHDTAIWRIRPASSCGRPTRRGTVTIITAGEHHRNIDGYTLCLAAPGQVEPCSGTPAESWTVTAGGALASAAGCLTVVDGRPVIEACEPTPAQHWKYTLAGNLISAGNRQCLTAGGPDGQPQTLTLHPCGHNWTTQVWSLPN